MPKFVTKPREIKAERYDKMMTWEQVEAIGGCYCQNCPSKAHVHTIHGAQFVVLEHGDWIVPESDGKHFYPIKPEVMDKNYELVAELKK